MTTAIDLFAGMGGASLGMTDAGVSVLWAANHWQLAVDAHAVNLPETIHACQDLNQANFYAVPDFDLLWASPACQGHSQASQPKRRVFHDALRSTAWAVVAACDAKMPAHFVVENVADFKRWRLYDAWERALSDLGYALESHTITASHHGVPQRRKRLFVIGTRGRAPMGLEFERGHEPACAPILESAEGIPLTSWKATAAATPSIQKRLAKGRGNHGERFLMQLVTGHPGVPLHEPLRTVTTKDQWRLVDGDRYRPLTPREIARAMGFPDSYRLPDASKADVIKGLGNAVCPPVAETITRAILAA